VLKQSESRLYRIGQLNSGGQGDRIYSQDGKSVSLSANGGGRGAKTGLYAISKPVILGDSPLQVLKEGRTELGKQSRKEIREKTGKDSTSRSAGHKAYYGREGIKANCVTTGLGAEGMVVENSVIRKLTPTECLRLQSMPDDYFDKALYKGKPISNTQRYKMCGNAFNCAVIEHILKHLI
jgi:site-specific DNA-cytosine methylase